MKLCVIWNMKSGIQLYAYYIENLFNIIHYCSSLQVSHSLERLGSVNNFTEFVKAFSQFGAEMVELAHLTGDRQNDLKDERRRAQMAAARQVLERSTMMLLTSSKVILFIYLLY